MRKKAHFRRHVIMLLVLAILIPVILISAVNILNLRERLISNFEVLIKADVERMNDQIKALDLKSVQSINLLSSDPNARAVYANPDSAMWLDKQLNAFAETHKDYQSVYMGVKDKRMIIAPPQKLPDGYDPTGRPWYTKAVQNAGKHIISEPYIDAGASGELMVTYAKTVLDVNSNQPIGVVGMDITLKNLSEMVNSIVLGENGYLMLLDENNRIIASKNAEYLEKGEAELQWLGGLIKGETEKIALSMIADQNYYFYKKINPETKWTVIGVIPQAELSSQVLTAALSSSVISLLALIAAILAGVMFANKLSTPIYRVAKVLDKIKSGDFTERVQLKGSHSQEINVIVSALNDTIDNIAMIIRTLMNLSEEVNKSSDLLLRVVSDTSHASEEVSKAVQDIASGATVQADNLDKGASITNDLGEQVAESAEKAEIMTSSARAVKGATDEGMNVVELLRNNFKETLIANNDVADQIYVLAENSNKITSITDTIRAITEQTNLLALNASIEAARAGEAGKGFAVVANEVRKLAEQSAASASEIYSVITEIKSSIGTVKQKIAYSIELNNKTDKSVEFTKESYEKIAEAIKTLEHNVVKMNESLDAINKNKNQVVDMIKEAASISQQTAAATEEVSASSEEQAASLQHVVNTAETLRNYANELSSLVSKFKL
ncbi:MAG: methyl-accepting chemotaxis protein [Bacillota bacterium]